MKQIKKISHPEFENAHKLTPLELNGLKIDDRHTVLSPELLDKISGRGKS